MPNTSKKLKKIAEESLESALADLDQALIALESAVSLASTILQPEARRRYLGYRACGCDDRRTDRLEH